MPLSPNTTVSVAIPDIYEGQTLEQLQTRLTARTRFVAFRFVNGREKFLASDGTIKTHDPASRYRFGGPRLIIGDVPREAVTFTELDEAPRVPRAGEWYIGPDGNYYQASATATFSQPYQIVARTVAPVQ